MCMFLFHFYCILCACLILSELKQQFVSIKLSKISKVSWFRSGTIWSKKKQTRLRIRPNVGWWLSTPDGLISSAADGFQSALRRIEVRCRALREPDVGLVMETWGGDGEGQHSFSSQLFVRLLFVILWTNNRPLVCCCCDDYISCQD